MKHFKAIAAMSLNRVIGNGNQIPWHLPEDFKWFKKMTTNQIVIMGSTTWRSLGCKPLPNRINIVLSRTHDYSGDGAADHTFSDPDTALVFCENEYPDKEIFIIGGDVVYRTYIDIVDRFYVTEIYADYQCDTFFDLKYVKEHFTNVTEHATFNEPLTYTIKEYNL